MLLLPMRRTGLLVWVGPLDCDSMKVGYGLMMTEKLSCLSLSLCRLPTHGRTHTRTHTPAHIYSNFRQAPFSHLPQVLAPRLALFWSGDDDPGRTQAGTERQIRRCPNRDEWAREERDQEKLDCSHTWRLLDRPPPPPDTSLSSTTSLRCPGPNLVNSKAVFQCKTKKNGHICDFRD